MCGCGVLGFTVREEHKLSTGGYLFRQQAMESTMVTVTVRRGRGRSEAPSCAPACRGIGTASKHRRWITASPVHSRYLRLWPSGKLTARPDARCCVPTNPDISARCGIFAGS